MSGSVNILLTTHNRPKMFARVCKMLNRQTYPIQNVIVLNDGSDMPYPRLPNHDIFEENKLMHRGKEGWWELVNFGLTRLKGIPAKYFIFLVDDFEFDEYFVGELIEKYESIPDNKKQALSYSWNPAWANRLNWAKRLPQRRRGFWLTQWLDMAFICEQDKFLKIIPAISPIDPHRWDNNPGLSSGVGMQITARLRGHGNLYHVAESMVKHGTHDSVMHPQERKINPLTAE